MNISIVLLSNMIQKDQMFITKWISIILGFVMNIFFEIANFFTDHNTLGISIILLTIFTRILMLPLSIKSQKSMKGMQEVQPEINKIKEKYGDSKDPELQQKMNVEIQQLYSKHKINPFGGCLPMLVQFPIFFALSFIMRESYLFINKLGDIYRSIATQILLITEIDIYAILTPIIYPKVPKNMAIDLSSTTDLMKGLNKFTPAEWRSFLEAIPQESAAIISELLQKKENVEVFFGIDLLANSGTGFPGIIIPISCAVFTFLTSYLMNKQQPAKDPSMKTQQKLMTYGMPLFIGWTTINFPAGVGIYWAVSNICQLVQQFFLNRYFGSSNKTDDKDKKSDSADKKTTALVKDKPKDRDRKRK